MSSSIQDSITFSEPDYGFSDVLAREDSSQLRPWNFEISKNFSETTLFDESDKKNCTFKPKINQKSLDMLRF